MAAENVRRVQELRRSNAAQPRPGKRDEGPAPEEWEELREPNSAQPCPNCGASLEQCMARTIFVEGPRKCCGPCKRHETFHVS